MTNRNFILLLIVTALIVGGGLTYFYFTANTTAPLAPGEDTNFLARFNPFNSTSPGPTETETPTYNTPAEETPDEIEVVNLKKVSSMPVAGFGIFKKERYKNIVVPPSVTTATPTTIKKPTPPPKEFASYVRYADKATGNIYQTFVDKLEERKFSGTVIPVLEEAYFGNKGIAVVMRYLKDDRTIVTFVGNLPKEILGADTSEDNQLKGTFLPENIPDVALSPDGLKLFYLLPMGDGVIGTTYGLVDGKKLQIFDSMFTEWLPFWPRNTNVTLSTKPSSSAPGYMYSLGVADKKLTRVLAGVNGLTTLGSPDGKLVLYAGGDLNLNVYNIAAKSTSSVGLRTLPEKCAWSKTSLVLYCAVPNQTPGGIYPDSWYKGQVSFSDQIWKVDIKTGMTTIISDPIATVNEEIDGVRLTLDEDERYLFLMNKKDSYLWELELN